MSGFCLILFLWSFDSVSGYFQRLSWKLEAGVLGFFRLVLRSLIFRMRLSELEGVCLDLYEYLISF